jgi:FMN phosphatase YigB (HAD superfamily)
LRAALVDVGGTLWPNLWPDLPDDPGFRTKALVEALAEVGEKDAPELVDRMLERIGSRNEHEPFGQQPDAAIRETLAEAGLRATPDVAMAVRHALCLPVHGRFRPLPGADVLLSTIRELGLRCVLASNTQVRDAEVYRRDFELFGLAGLIDGIVTSVDVGRLKPHEALFAEALRVAGCPAEHAVMLGNNEEADVIPAKRLGMRTVLVHPDDPPPRTSAADAVAPTLETAAAVLREWCASGRE